MGTSEVPLIDAAGRISANANNVIIPNAGTKFNVVSILGPQNGGKSTLLNEVFGTEFETGDKDREDRKTTQGVWIARDELSPTLIIDIEGNDPMKGSRDRILERRAGIFALAISDTIMINMHFKDVGRGRNRGLPFFEDLLEAYGEIFERGVPLKKKPLVIVVLRDYFDRPAMFRLVKRTHQRLIERWDRLQFPSLKDLLVTDLFNLEVHGVANPFTHQGLFVADCLALRKLIIDKSPPSYSKKVPMKDFIEFAECVWKNILNTSDLEGDGDTGYRLVEIRFKAIGKLETIPIENLYSSSERMLIENIVYEALAAFDKHSFTLEEDEFDFELDIFTTALFDTLETCVESYLTQYGRELIISMLETPAWQVRASFAVQEALQYEAEMKRVMFPITYTFKTRNLVYNEEGYTLDVHGYKARVKRVAKAIKQIKDASSPILNVISSYTLHNDLGNLRAAVQEEFTKQCESLVCVACKGVDCDSEDVTTELLTRELTDRIKSKIKSDLVDIIVTKLSVGSWLSSQLVIRAKHFFTPAAGVDPQIQLDKLKEVALMETQTFLDVLRSIKLNDVDILTEETAELLTLTVLEKVVEVHTVDTCVSKKHTPKRTVVVGGTKRKPRKIHLCD